MLCCLFGTGTRAGSGRWSAVDHLLRGEHRHISDRQLDIYRRQGFLIVENLLTEEERRRARHALKLHEGQLGMKCVGEQYPTAFTATISNNILGAGHRADHFMHLVCFY